MNNKGFAISGIIYGVLIVFLLLVFSVLGILINRKVALDKIKNDAMNTVLGNYGESLEMPNSMIFNFDTISINSNGVEYMKTFDYSSLVYSPYGYTIIATTNFDYAVDTSGTITFSAYNGSNLISSVDKTIKVTGNSKIDSYDYSGQAKEVLYQKGLYKLEVWGARGGSSDSYYGKGGYSTGIYRSSNDKFYIYVGGAGSLGKGGFNGGGATTPNAYGGGGATDIRIKEDSIYSRIIVAGGGGGRAEYLNGQNNTTYGGGFNGGGGYVNDTSGTSGTGGTQNTPGKGGIYNSFIGIDGVFGAGGTALDSTSDGGGGGGGFYGGGSGASGTVSNGGGGGSGFVWNAISSNFVPNKYTLMSSQYLFDASTIDGNSAFPTTNGASTETGHDGNGYAKITQLVIFE